MLTCTRTVWKKIDTFHLPVMALELSTADVYEQASLIGQDIEKVIDRFGHESVMDFMPKVIKVLEYLEVLVRSREKENLEIAELKLENERLYVEIKKEANQRRRLDEVLCKLIVKMIILMVCI